MRVFPEEEYVVQYLSDTEFKKKELPRLAPIVTPTGEVIYIPGEEYEIIRLEKPKWMDWGTFPTLAEALDAVASFFRGYKGAAAIATWSPFRIIRRYETEEEELYRWDTYEDAMRWLEERGLKR